MLLTVYLNHEVMDQFKPLIPRIPAVHEVCTILVCVSESICMRRLIRLTDRSTNVVHKNIEFANYRHFIKLHRIVVVQRLYQSEHTQHII